MSGTSTYEQHQTVSDSTPEIKKKDFKLNKNQASTTSLLSNKLPISTLTNNATQLNSIHFKSSNANLANQITETNIVNFNSSQTSVSTPPRLQNISSNASITSQTVLNNNSPSGSNIVANTTTPPSNATTTANNVNFSGYLMKWTNYIKGYQKRWFVLNNGLLSYFR